MSQIFLTRRTPGGGQEFTYLDETWPPWKYQVNGYVDDGTPYGAPKNKKTYHTMSNFRTYDEAQDYWERSLVSR